MSCYACGAVIDCSEFGGITLDLPPSVGFFATQNYSFLLDCPPGYFCFPGFYPIVITIPSTDIPPVNQTGDRFSIYGCQGMVSVQIPVGISNAATQQLVNGLFAQWAFQEAQCRLKKSPAPGIPPPTRIPTGKGNRTDVYNEIECFTAHCVPESAGDPKTDCVDTHTFHTTLFDATDAQIAAAQAQVNALATDQATRLATAALTCGVCNAVLHDFKVCPTDGTKVASATIPAGTYCTLTGTQFQMDSMASIALTNQLTALLTGLGCTCPGAVIGGGVNGHDITIAAPCGMVQATWNLNSPTGPFAISPSFNPEVQWCNFNAAGYPCTHPALNSDLFSSIFPLSHLKQFIAAHP